MSNRDDRYYNTHRARTPAADRSGVFFPDGTTSSRIMINGSLTMLMYPFPDMEDTSYAYSHLLLSLLLAFVAAIPNHILRYTALDSSLSSSRSALSTSAPLRRSSAISPS
ncbi:hypothetical protein B0H13DRAFT_2346646 [Mycena leptocephala]|nr:hypothetical protein B0H13DRAFT_2346646 [Mycena leptocephala]